MIARAENNPARPTQSRGLLLPKSKPNQLCGDNLLTALCGGAIRATAIIRKPPSGSLFSGGSMNQGDLIKKVSASASITKAEAERAINAVKGAITDSLRKGNKVTLVGFGTFGVSHRKARRGFNPYSSKIMKIPAAKTIRFSAGKQLKEAVNKRKK